MVKILVEPNQINIKKTKTNNIEKIPIIILTKYYD
jgi:hypothetical protein